MSRNSKLYITGRCPLFHIIRLSERREFCHPQKTSIASGASVPETETDAESPKLFMSGALGCERSNGAR